MAKTFLQQKGNYRDLIAFQKAECIYDITYYFAHKYLKVNDRTVDQMILPEGQKYVYMGYKFRKGGPNSPHMCSPQRLCILSESNLPQQP